MENPDTQQPHTDQHERHEVDVPLQRTDNLVDEQPRQHDRKEKQRDQHPGKRVVYLVVVDQERGIERHDQHGVGDEEIERHQPGELTAVDHLVPQLDALFRLGKGALPLEQERQRERNTRQGIDQEGQVPVDVGQVARHDGRQHERQVVDRRAVPQLPDTVIARKVVDHEPRGEGDYHTGADTEDTADDDEPHHAPGEEACHAAQEEDRQSDGEDLELVLADGELAGKQDEGDDQQRGQRREHLYFKVGGLREDFIQVAEDRRDRQPRQRGDCRHRPYRQQHPERNRTFACLDFHCQWIYTPTQQVLYQSRAGRHVAGPPCRIGCTYLPCCFTQRT